VAGAPNAKALPVFLAFVCGRDSLTCFVDRSQIFSKCWRSRFGRCALSASYTAALVSFVVVVAAAVAVVVVVGA
jgi:hypothetical protein